MKLKIKDFRIEITKVNGEIISLLNITNHFNYKVLNAFEDLKTGDLVRLFDINCLFPTGMDIMAKEYKTIIR